MASWEDRDVEQHGRDVARLLETSSGGPRTGDGDSGEGRGLGGPRPSPLLRPEPWLNALLIAGLAGGAWLTVIGIAVGSARVTAIGVGAMCVSVFGLAAGTAR